jgi:hypothetical protein
MSDRLILKSNDRASEWEPHALRMRDHEERRGIPEAQGTYAMPRKPC